MSAARQPLPSDRQADSASAVEPTRFEVLPGIPGAEFSPGGAGAGFAVIRPA